MKEAKQKISMLKKPREMPLIWTLSHLATDLTVFSTCESLLHLVKDNGSSELAPRRDIGMQRNIWQKHKGKNKLNSCSQNKMMYKINNFSKVSEISECQILVNYLQLLNLSKHQPIIRLKE